MTHIDYNGQSYSVEAGESVLDALLRQGVELPHSCKIGTCQSCLTKLVKGDVPLQAQKGLQETLVAKDYFLACQCMPETDIVAVPPNQSEAAVASNIIDLSMMNHNILRVRLSAEGLTDFRAGQYINLLTPTDIIRSYSIANIPAEYIELHTKLVPNGLMSDWLQKQAKVGDPIHIRGPMGNCFYHNLENKPFPMVLAGTGTGLAPLIGIVNDALKNEHNHEITLIHGGVTESDLYLHNMLLDLEDSQSNFRYVPCVLNGDTTVTTDQIDNVLIEELKRVEGNLKLYICGPEETTKKLKLRAFLAGVPSAAILSDAFIAAGSSTL